MYSDNNKKVGYAQETEAHNHMDAFDFMIKLVDAGVTADLIILDPPYSMHQVNKSYSGFGDKRVNSLTPIYYMANKLLMANGVVLNFGFNSNGICLDHYEMVEILLVAHGGHHNDTICVAEKKLAHQPNLFQSQTSKVEERI